MVNVDISSVLGWTKSAGRQDQWQCLAINRQAFGVWLKTEADIYDNVSKIGRLSVGMHAQGSAVGVHETQQNQTANT